MSIVRAVDGQETGLSVQPAEKKNRLQTGQEFHLQSALVQASLLLKYMYNYFTQVQLFTYIQISSMYWAAGGSAE